MRWLRICLNMDYKVFNRFEQLVKRCSLHSLVHVLPWCCHFFFCLTLLICKVTWRHLPLKGFCFPQFLWVHILWVCKKKEKKNTQQQDVRAFPMVVFGLPSSHSAAVGLLYKEFKCWRAGEKVRNKMRCCGDGCKCCNVLARDRLQGVLMVYWVHGILEWHRVEVLLFCLHCLNSAITGIACELFSPLLVRVPLHPTD